jgi:hypothetical protein
MNDVNETRGGPRSFGGQSGLRPPKGRKKQADDELVSVSLSMFQEVLNRCVVTGKKSRTIRILSELLSTPESFVYS